MPEIRDYSPSDQTSWLRCRVLSFLDTNYFDDVWTSRPDDSQIQLVAVDGPDIVGIIDLCVEGSLATVDTVCIHPDHRSRGIGTALLEAAVTRLPQDVTVLDAWTRGDPGTLAWYRARGFTESDHYLHVYRSHPDPLPDGMRASAPFIGPVIGFFHAPIEHEAQMREEFQRVHVCRRMSRILGR